MLGFLDELTPGQRQLLTGLASLVVLLALAVGVVALGDDGGPDDAVVTEAGPATTTTAGGDALAAPEVSTSTTGAAGAEEPDGGPPRRSTTTAATTARGTRSSGTSTTRATRGGSEDRGGGGVTTSTTRAATTTTRDEPDGSGCTTGGSGGAAADIATRYCAHRAANGATARMERSSRLDAAAASWAQELAQRNGLEHGPYAAAVREVCPSCVPGENVAYWDAPNVQGAWSEWLKSPPHRRALDDRRGGYYGTGSAALTPGGRTFYVHVFAWLP